MHRKSDTDHASHSPVMSRRASGLLLPIFSLPAEHGIGDLGTAAFRFIDFLHQAGQSYWQILPTGATDPACANSPYMSPSAFAGNPLLISIESLVADGLLSAADVPTIGTSEYIVDYDQATRFKRPLLRLAWERFSSEAPATVLKNFTRQHPWVTSYSLFQVLKQHYDHAPWFQWPHDVRKAEPQTLAAVTAENATAIGYHTFEQYLFFRQWEQLHTYAASRGVQIIGDIPIYVAEDSADVWANQSIFQLDPRTSRPTHVAGVPPDYFSDTGQHWGNPLYRWKTTDRAAKTALWQWWEARLRHNFSLTDIIRIDHFRGFEAYWSIPADEKTAINGKWVNGPGVEFFKDMERAIGSMPIIAEDLGVITPAVEKLRKDLGFPGMRILLFAFDGNTDNSYLPHNHTRDSVVFTGTHDNDTAVGWFLSPDVPEQNKRQAKQYANQSDPQAGIFHRDMIHLALSSVADTVIIPLQDVLGFGNDCRMNTPGTSEGNWQWRCAPRFLTQELAAWLHEQTSAFGRLALSSSTSKKA